MTTRRSDGFTLIELITVVVILSILMSMAAVRLDWAIPQYAMRADSRAIGSFLKTARDNAVTRGKEVYAEFDLSEGTYWMLVPMEKETDDQKSGENQPSSKPQYEYTRLFFSKLDERVQFVTIILAQDQIITTGKATVRLTPFGTANHLIVNLKNNDALEMAVKFNGFTGALSFYDHHLKAEDILEDEE